MSDSSFNAKFRSGELTAQQVVFQADRLSVELERARQILDNAREYCESSALKCVKLHPADMLDVLDGTYGGWAA